MNDFDVERFETACRAWLAYEQQLFLRKGSINHPEVVRTRAVFAPLWDGLTEREKQMLRNGAYREENYPKALTTAPPVASAPASSASVPPPPAGA